MISHSAPKPCSNFIVSVFGDPDRQEDLDAILTFAPAGRQLPGTPRGLAEPGTAVAGSAASRPLPVWCVVPVLSADREPEDTVRQALDEGLHLADEHGFRRLGVVLGRRELLILPWRDLVKLVVGKLAALGDEGRQFDEVRLIATDSKVTALIEECLIQQELCYKPSLPA